MSMLTGNHLRGFEKAARIASEDAGWCNEKAETEKFLGGGVTEAERNKQRPHSSKG